MNTEKNIQETCWLDEAGKLLEQMGYEPGKIFEFHDSLHPNLKNGGVIGTNLPSGQRPIIGPYACLHIGHI